MKKVTMRNGENDFIGGMIFHKRVKRVIDMMEPDEELAIDLSGLYLDSSVIGTLLAIFTTCKKKQIPMRIVNLSDESCKVLTITGVINILNVERTKGEAGN